jgi:hypothetical protein
MEYLAVSGTYPEELTEKVNAALIKGYKLQGGISGFSEDKYRNKYVQALYKEIAPKGGERKTRRSKNT